MPHQSTFRLVAIGASAGGLEAISELLENLDPSTGMTYVYIQHLDPTHKSLLSTILSRSTGMKVQEASNRLEIKPNNLYIIPPDKDMTLLNGTLQLKTRKPKPSIQLPIDHFFASLAEIYKEDAIGVVLSGNASDGSYGLKMIKKAGGITFAQDDSARFQSMPKSAVSEGVVDMVLSPKQIAEEINRISKEIPGVENEDLSSVIQLLKNSTGVDFTHYKTNTVKRRIIRRMLLYKLDTLMDYHRYLREHPNEIATLYEDLLIHVTSFFRDTETTDHLKKTIIPRIIKAKEPGEPIRVWVPACATGEEAYTLAMIFLEAMEESSTNVILQIFATDLSEVAIAKARMGLYSRNDLAPIAPKTVQRYFAKLDGSYRISKTIRDLCVFAPHNIFRDPPFSRMDLISCCNLLIYLDPILQKKVMATLHYSLNERGILVLGKSESVGSYPQLFLQTDKKYKVFTRKKESGTNVMLEMNHRMPSVDRTDAFSTRKAVRKNTSTEMTLEKTVDEILLNDYAPASVVVNQDLEILQVRGSTSLFLRLSPGKASFNLMKMAHTDLALELRAAIHKSAKSGEKITKGELLLRNKEAIHQVAIEVTPLPSESEEKLFLLVFRETDKPVPKEKPNAKDDTQVSRLQDEISSLREDMRSIIEEQQATVEELQSANEEIVSSNEELQSINEELETSKEELESSNEELMTINSEMQVRNEQLSESYEYAESVFDTIREAVIVLDNDLRIKSANAAFYSIFKLKQSTIEGTMLFEMDDGSWNIARLRELLEVILPKKSVFHGFEIRHVFPRIGEKVMIVNAQTIVQRIHQRKMILLAIEDITEHWRAKKIIAEREAWFRNLADRAPVMIWSAGNKETRDFVNTTWLEFTGRSMEQEVGSGWKESIHPDDLAGFEHIYAKSFTQCESYTSEYRLLRYDGEYRWMLDSGKPIFSPDNNFIGYLGSCTEIHDKKVAQEELEEQVIKRTRDLHEMNKELKRSNNDLEQFAYVASHDLQEPLRKILTFSDRLEDFKESIPDNGLNYLAKITQASQRMSKLIDDLLNFSKISVNNEHFINLDLNDILKNELPDFDLMIQDKGATVKIDPLPAVWGIEVQIEQLIHNLLSNSLKFAQKDIPPVIRISGHKLSPDEISRHGNLDPLNNYVEIVFWDNGIGFKEEFAEKIFIIFQRLNDKSNYPGTGIGLALCRKIVEYHGGEIFARSSPGKETAFHVILPGSH